MYVYTWKKVGIRATGCRRLSQKKKRRKTSKIYAKCINWLKFKGKKDAKICSEILVAIVFRFCSGVNI